jgi:hypothetical protein
MQWTYLTRRGQPFRLGRAAWTSGGSPSFTSWRWHARPFGGLSLPSCLPEEAWADPETSDQSEMGWARDPGPGNAGSLAARLDRVDSDLG